MEDVKNIRVLIEITPQGVYYCTESKKQKQLRVNDLETDSFGSGDEYWEDWYKVNDIQEVVDWLKSS